MKPQSGKAKSRALQNYVAKDCARLSSLTYGKPGDELADFAGRPMGQPGSDLVRSEKARKVFPFITECKNTESWKLSESALAGDYGIVHKWWEILVQRAHGEGEQIILIVKHNHSPAIAFLDSFWFVNTCEEYMRRYGQYAMNKAGGFVVVPWHTWSEWWFGDHFREFVEDGRRQEIDLRLAEGLEDITHGRGIGPFSSAKEGIRALHREAKKLKRAE